MALRPSVKKASTLERVQIGTGIVVSLATLFIGWQTFQLGVLTDANKAKLEQIGQSLEAERFGFEQIRDVYDRTEQYLASENQSEIRGKALVVLIRSMPEGFLRQQLLILLTKEAQLPIIAAQAVADSSTVQVDTAAILEELDPNSFTGSVSFQINSDGYTVRVENEFGFKDSKGVAWLVPAGFVSDGASIPRALWSVVGAPLSGNYTVPAIIHDYYSTTRTRSVEDTNGMFYEAMLKSGVDNTTATLMLASLTYFGPRWTVEN